MGKASEAATEYFRCMRERDANAMEALFAADAVLSVFNGTVRRGKQEIRDFYEYSAFRGGLRPNPGPPIEDGSRCAVEIVVGRDNDSYQRVVDIFTVNEEGEVTSLRIYEGLLLQGDRPR
jgi:hypothetical protein